MALRIVCVALLLVWLVSDLRMSLANQDSERKPSFAGTFSLGRTVAQSYGIFATLVKLGRVSEGQGTYKGSVMKSLSPDPTAYAIVYLACSTSIGLGKPVEPEECTMIAGRVLSFSISTCLWNGNPGSGVS